MKKIFFSVLALGLAFSSCSNVEDEGVSNGAKQTVNFELSAPEAFAEGTRAGDYVNSAKGGVTNLAGETITYHLAFYYGGNLEWSGTQTSTAASVKFQPELIIGESYKLVAYATFGGEQADLTNIAVSSGINNEANDAYSCTKDVEASLTMSATLTRPSAKLRFLAKDYETGKAHGFEITKVSVQYTNNYAETFNAYTGQYGSGTTNTSAADAVKYTASENTVFTDYIPVNADVDETVDVAVTYTKDGNETTRTFTFTPVPLKRNYLTTIMANVWKEQAEVEIIIDEALAEIPSNDGVTYYITNPAELMWLSKEVANGETFKGKTIVLESNIDLENQEWTPIGNSTTAFQGTFDGNGYTISNLKIDQATKSNMGLFGYTTNGTIKNVHINNATIKGRLNVGVVAGTPYTSKYENIKITGLVQVDGMAYVGTVGGKNAYANWNNITVDVEDGSYVKANSVEDGIAYRTYVGGVVGFMGEGGHKMSNITSNIDVIGTTIDVGGITGIAHYGNTFENCSSSGNVEITAAEDASDAEQIGGIAGVWHNGGSPVSFINCKYTGTLKVNYTNGVDLSDNTIVGSAYSTTGSGQLIMDCPTNVKDADGLVEALENGEDVVLLDDVKIDPAGMSNAYGTTGINVKNGQTIDGNGNTLDIKGAGGTWDSGISTTGGLIKDITITGSFRGIFVNHNSTHTEEVVLENVTIEGTTYTISCDQGANQNLSATNSTFKGWTSYAATIGTVSFKDCYFGKGNGYAYCRPYAPTTFEGCEFEAGYKIDPRAAVTFINCTFGGQPLTAENLATLLTNTTNATIK